MEFLGISVQTRSGKLNWQDLRRVLYVLLFTWLIGVRLLGLNIMDDFTRTQGVGLDTLFDAAALYVIYLIGWHIFWPARPKIA